ncbi:MAG TPA: GNAT family N-acetyltransferase [Streptosporangiaceae bacterium]|nr:GNAT family N-acetyltransferase [Streptosporangiaceae bacterium]
MTAQLADVAVRQLVADDWAQARSARLAALADAPYAFSSTLAKEQAYDERLWRRRAGSGRTFGAFDGATIVGLATGIPVDELDGHAASSPGAGGERPGSAQPTWQLVGMWVAPAYRGQGVADRLVDAVCERARHADAGTVALWVTEMNDRAIAFYRRLGFAPTGVRQPVRPEEPDRWEKELALRLR